MKTTVLAALLGVYALPALAHGGAHVHPHPESASMYVGFAVLVLAAGLVAYKRWR